jgi:bifunctional DNA-binding transcriptional regulator/antitoxin component of YhaV-PrlF toxin-antitoxin module
MAHTATATGKRQAAPPVQVRRELGINLGDGLVLEKKTNNGRRLF